MTLWGPIAPDSTSLLFSLFTYHIYSRVQSSKYQHAKGRVGYYPEAKPPRSRSVSTRICIVLVHHHQHHHHPFLLIGLPRPSSYLTSSGWMEGCPVWEGRRADLCQPRYRIPSVFAPEPSTRPSNLIRSFTNIRPCARHESSCIQYCTHSSLNPFKTLEFFLKLFFFLCIV